MDAAGQLWVLTKAYRLPGFLILYLHPFLFPPFPLSSIRRMTVICSLCSYSMHSFSKGFGVESLKGVSGEARREVVKLASVRRSPLQPPPRRPPQRIKAISVNLKKAHLLDKKENDLMLEISLMIHELFC